MTDTTDSHKWLILVLVLGLGWLVYLLGPVLTPFIAGGLLAYLGDPLADRLEDKKIGPWSLGRTGAVVFVFALMTLALVIVLLVVVPLLENQFEQLGQKMPEYLDWLKNTALPWIQGITGVEGRGFTLDTITEMIKQYWQEAGGIATSLLSSITKSSVAVLAWLANIVLIPVVTFYLLRDWDKLTSNVRTLLPLHVEPTVMRLAQESDEVLGAFIRGQLWVMLALGLVYSIGLWLVGIDFAFLIGMGAGILSFVPYLGSILGVAAALVAALVQYHDVLHIVLVLVVFGVGQSLEGMVLTPLLVGDKIGLHPVAVIFAVLAGGQLFGFTGVLLALPAASVLMVLLRHVHEVYKTSRLYDKDPIRFEDV